MQAVQVRKSPKKRPLKRYTIVSSSSSTESLTSDTKGNQLENTQNAARFVSNKQPKISHTNSDQTTTNYKHTHIQNEARNQN